MIHRRTTANPLVLTVNSGSSSIKFAIYRIDSSLECVVRGSIDRIGREGTTFHLIDAERSSHDDRPLGALDHPRAIAYFMAWLQGWERTGSLRGIGHRVVHGLRYSSPERVTDLLIEELHRIIPCDREHLPSEIALIEGLRSAFPEVPQIACFDTAFHRDMPAVAKRLPIPRHLASLGIERYGFHGLSFAYLMHELRRLCDPSALAGRVVLAHLGNGASLAAVRDGHCIDTTMGFTPTAGLVMSTRTGDMDPGLMSYLVMETGMTMEAFSHMASFESGMLGISETSSDVQELLRRRGNDERAADALETFCYSAKKWIGAMAAALGGLDTLVFAGGIGENAPWIRSRICQGLQFLELELDSVRNEQSGQVISTDRSRVHVRIIPTDEQQMIARLVCKVLSFEISGIEETKA